MQNVVRTHGQAPYHVAVLHGGPGAPGTVEPVARTLGACRGVLEPFQGAVTLQGQVDELRRQLLQCADFPVTLIGHSWGAWLAWILATQHPCMVQRLVLVSSGAFQEDYAADLMDTRRARLSKEQRSEVNDILDQMAHEDGLRDDALLARFGALMSTADRYHPLPGEIATVTCDMEIFQGVWPEAADLRRKGQLLALGEQICCPVVAIHGDHDPSPAEGVEKPLSSILADFRFILLEKCGHSPWEERYAREPFYRELDRILGT